MKLKLNAIAQSIVLLAGCAWALSASSQTLPTQAPTVLLAPVVVTATRFDESQQSATYAVSVITEAQIRASGASSVNEAIIKLLGVPGRLDTSGGGNYTLDLRGFGATADSNQVVIVDGQRLNEADMSATNLAVVPIETVERIEVMRGSGAVQYGEGATAGVIVVTTKSGKGLSRHNTATLGMTVGTDNLREARATAVMSSGDFSVDVSAKDVRSEGHRDNFASTANNLSASAQWSNDWLRIGVQSGRYMMQSGWPGSLTATQYAENSRQTSSPRDFGSIKSETTGVFAQAFLDDWEFGLNANQRTKKFVRYLSGNGEDNVAASNVNLRARQQVRGQTLANSLVVGLDTSQWADTVLQSTYKTIGSIADAKADAVYISNGLTFLQSGTHLNLGIRTEQLKKNDANSATTLEDRPRAWQVGFSQSINRSTVGYGHVGQSYRLANVDEFSYASPSTLLQTQTSRDVEAGIRWSQQANRVEFRWYRNEIDNEIGYDPKAADPYGGNTGANVNFLPTLHQGVELEMTWQPMASLDVRANAAVREAKFVQGPYSGNSITLTPRKTVALGANWRPQAGHVLDVGLVWVDTQFPDFNNTCTIPSYSTVDMRYAYTKGNVEFAFGVKNAGDTKYYTYAYDCTSGVTGGIYPEAGRTATASVQIKF
jgi:iron complex outermembrane recepter protein